MGMLTLHLSQSAESQKKIIFSTFLTKKIDKNHSRGEANNFFFQRQKTPSPNIYQLIIVVKIWLTAEYVTRQKDAAFNSQINRNWFGIYIRFCFLSKALQCYRNF